MIHSKSRAQCNHGDFGQLEQLQSSLGFDAKDDSKGETNRAPAQEWILQQIAPRMVFSYLVALQKEFLCYPSSLLILVEKALSKKLSLS
jgi:hypothetical protein